MVMEMAEDERDTRIDCPVLVTERLVMRPPHREDIADLAMLANNRRVAEIADWVGSLPRVTRTLAPTPPHA